MTSTNASSGAAVFFLQHDHEVEGLVFHVPQVRSSSRHVEALDIDKSVIACSK